MAEIRGVNLGGWFVLEKWMKPDLFEGVTGPDETVFCKEKPNAKEVLEKHWQNFITESDFAFLNKCGLNSVRLPIPWWAFEECNPYFSCVTYIDKAMDLAKKYQLKVLLDLHTAPGCQNGFDNGGVTGVIDWPKSQTNIDLTVRILEKIAKRYSSHEALWGIELLNEPHWTIDLNLLQKFYLEGYQAIRKHLKNQVIVFHDGFRPDDESWVNFFKNNQLENVAFDLHLYQCFNHEFADMKIEGHIHVALNRSVLVNKISQFVRVIVGEWSLGLHELVFNNMDEFNKKVCLTMYANAQLHSFEKGFGFYFWSYKIERNSHLGWDFKRLVDAGIFPNSYK
ncbi:MAG: hypothetical protein K0Q49_497 [Haloplasmataceae bacterium]|jgi:glucan 1,3-beta-glucosidase|nr:hypothetical protein [Haloplasmataceae bacterium]